MTQNNIKIAITGGIGSGKSTVANIIKSKGFAVYSCDEIYSELLKNSDFIEKIGSMFDGVINNGTLDRKKLADIVFNDTSALKKLDDLTHKEIMRAAFERMNDEKLSFLEVPVLFENGYEKYFDSVIVILRDKDKRIESIVERDKISANQAQLRINSQYNYDFNNFMKYYVIHNDDNFAVLEAMVEETIDKIIKKF